jgi:hypothetical protein
MISTRTVSHRLFSVALPPSWTANTADADATKGQIGRFSGQGHQLFVERVLDGWVPIKALMGQVALENKRLLDGYESAEARGIVVVGGGAASQRLVITEEGDASYLMLELYVQGLDGFMWYVRVTALRHEFNHQVADAIVDSFTIRFVQENSRV